MQMNIAVRFTAGAHLTNTVRGVRASSTCSAVDAAQSFGQKFFGPSFLRVELLPASQDGAAICQVISEEVATAYCWQSGRIDVGDEVPEGAIAVATGPRRALQEKLEIYARHGQGKSKGVLLVPGVPEADEGDAKVDALSAWLNWCAERNGRKDSYHVLFNGKAKQRKPGRTAGVN